jgi:hypothetical protein
MLIDQQHAAADQHDTGHLRQAEGLVPKHMREYCDDGIARCD